MKTGSELIVEERARQISVEGWTPGHDDEHDENQLALAAACYALPPDVRCWGEPLKRFTNFFNALWPWDSKWWKPTPNDRVRELAKAGALIAAEIDRLQRGSNHVDNHSGKL